MRNKNKLDLIGINEVTIITRDINGKRIVHSYPTWDKAVVNPENMDSEEEILLVLVGNICVWSQLGCEWSITWGEVAGFFA